MTRRFFTRATENPLNPEARGICDRCGMVHDHNALRPQTRQGPGSVKTSLLLVCPGCYDLLIPWMRTFWVPQDPPNIAFPSPEAYTIDEAGSYPPARTTGAPYMLGGAPLGVTPLGGAG
jgi:hypothetical protein